MWESILGETLGGEPVNRMGEDDDVSWATLSKFPRRWRSNGGGKATPFSATCTAATESEPIGSRRIDTKFRLHDATPNRTAQ
ncbi:hypothetical protein IFM47457_07535 [Aspergillus lentulus]|nr:hypothetical protein IFM47457_07535 [Aspergillus lentulus]